jgi:hypothetical protein
LSELNLEPVDGYFSVSARIACVEVVGSNEVAQHIQLCGKVPGHLT